MKNNIVIIKKSKKHKYCLYLKYCLTSIIKKRWIDNKGIVFLKTIKIK